MAIEYHEGLPGAGKSYEACVYHILPAIKARRTVVTNIRGMNAEKIAELTGERLELVELLLINVTPAEQDADPSEVQRCINQMCNQTPDNALIVWDEIQDYFPSGNYKLPLNQQKFWTEHRHRGLDIIIMGQDRGDVHKIIRNRIRTVIYFLKLEAVGRPDKYKWEIYQKQQFGKFVKTGSGTRDYDSKYFGMYMSHRREGVKATVYQTERTNLLANNRALSLGVPAAFVVAGFAVWHLWGFFHAKPVQQTAAAVKVERAAPVAVSQLPAGLVNPPPPNMPVAAHQGAQQAAKVEEKSPPVDYFDKLAQTLQVRVSALIDSEKQGKELLGYIELLDSSYHVKELFTVAEIRALGWTVTRTGYGLLLEKETAAYVARSWPIDLYGRVDNRTVKSLDGSPSGSPRASVEAATGTSPGASVEYVPATRVTQIPDTEYASRPWR